MGLPPQYSAAHMEPMNKEPMYVAWVAVLVGKSRHLVLSLFIFCLCQSASTLGVLTHPTELKEKLSSGLAPLTMGGDLSIQNNYLLSLPVLNVTLSRFVSK